MARTPQSGAPAERDGPPPHATTTDRPPTSTTGDSIAPCCCKIVIWLERVTVETPTDAGSLPVISSLFGLAPDHVFIRAEDDTGKVVKYPDDARGIVLGRGESAGSIELATFRSDPADGCQINRQVKVMASKESRFNLILDRIRGVEGKIAAIMADISKNSQAYSALMSLMPPNIAAAAPLMAQILADQKKLDDLMSALADLLKELAGTADTLMDQFTIYVDGKVPCGDAKWIAAMREPAGWAQDPQNPDRATLTWRIDHLGGVWVLRLAALRICPQGSK
jgi:hypothetical protein